jgi:uncharacterized protein YcnI
LGRAAVAVGALALAWPSGALAHVTASPHEVPPGEQTLVFRVPNEAFDPHEQQPIHAVVVAAPRGLRLEQAEAKPGWTTKLDGQTARWIGGSIPYHQFETFAVIASIPSGTSELRFQATEEFASRERRIEHYPVLIRVDTGRDASSSHGVAVAALVVAVVTAAVVTGLGLFLGLSRWLRGT